MSGQTYTIVIEQDRDRRFALDAVRRARFGMQVKVSRATRTTEQNALLHAQLTDIAEQLVWPPPPRNDGELHDIEFWKRRTTLQWMIDSNMRPEVIVALEGEEFGLLLPHTSDLTTEQCASLSEWLWAFGTQHGVLFKEPNRGPTPPPPDPKDYR